MTTNPDDTTNSNGTSKLSIGEIEAISEEVVEKMLDCSEYVEDPPVAIHRTPERQLICAVLLRAMLDLRSENRRIRLSARQFVASNSRRPFSFLWCLESLQYTEDATTKMANKIRAMMYQKDCGMDPLWRDAHFSCKTGTTAEILGYGRKIQKRKDTGARETVSLEGGSNASGPANPSGASKEDTGFTIPSPIPACGEPNGDLQVHS